MKKRIILLLCIGFLALSAASQSRSHANRPPWIVSKASSWQVGRLPDLNLRHNVLRVSFSVHKNREQAKENAKADFLREVLSHAGVDAKADSRLTNIRELDKTENGSQERRVEQLWSEVTVEGKTFARYTILDEYYEYHRGMWHYAALFQLADNGKPIEPVEPIAYGVKKGAWRSIFIPGAAQFYQRRPLAGFKMLAMQGLLVGGTIQLNSWTQYYDRRMNEAFSIEVKQDYKKRKEQMQAYTAVALGASVAWYFYNLLDAYNSSKGKSYYLKQGRRTQLSLQPTVLPDPHTPSLGVACTFNF